MLLKNTGVAKVIGFISIGLFSVSSYAAYYNYEPFNNLKRVAEDFVMKNIALNADETMDVHVVKLNTPLRVAMCSQPIEAAFPQNSNRERITAVELTCSGTNSWHMMMPVTVKINSNVLVAKRTISPSQVITEDDLDYAQHDRNTLFSGYFIKKEETIGQVASQTISPGTVLTKRNIQLPVLVHRNEAVEIIARSHSVVVSMKGIAKTDGSMNQSVKVYNPSSKRTLDALVVGTGKAEVV